MRRVDPVAIGAEIEGLIREIRAGADAQVGAQAQELVRLLLALYGEGLAAMLDIVRTERGGSNAILERFASDPLVASLLVLHDVHPHPLDVRVERAVVALTPHLPAGTHVTLVSADVDSVRVAVQRTSASAGQSGETLRLAIERAIREAAPEVSAIHVDGLDDRLIQVIRTPQNPERPS